MRIVVNSLDIGESKPYIITDFKSSVIGNMRLNTYEIPQTPSVKFVSNYTKGITMEIEVSILADTHEQLLEYVRNLKNAFYPQANTELDMVIYTDNDEIYRAKGYLVSDFDYKRQITFAKTSFTVLIPSGQIKGNALQSQTLSQAGVASGAILPWTLPVILGDVTGGATITNSGNANAPINITITGPGTNFTVLNQTTGVSISIDGLALSSSQTIEINGENQTVTQAGVSIYQFVSDDSNFIQLIPGANNFAFYVDSGATSDSSAIITWYNTYVGI